MTYSQEISRETPGAFLFLVDQSRSMNKEFGKSQDNGPVTRAAVVADALNNTLAELVNRCTRDEGVTDYFEIGVIGYGRTSRPAFCWEDGLARRTMVPISEVAAHARTETSEVETIVRGNAVKETVTISKWLSPVALESTPMNAALIMARATLEQWIYNHPKSFPPIVINITDGMANDVNSEEELLVTARRLTNLKTTDGNVLMINCHISGDVKRPVVFPWSPLEIPDEPYAKLLFEMSSEMPNRHKAVICELFNRDLDTTPTVRGMAFNADAVALVKLLDIGTRHAFAFPQESRFKGGMQRPVAVGE
nr:conserved uncharacterized protein [uncultured bacterium]